MKTHNYMTIAIAIAMAASGMVLLSALDGSDGASYKIVSATYESDGFVLVEVNETIPDMVNAHVTGKNVDITTQMAFFNGSKVTYLDLQRTLPVGVYTLTLSQSGSSAWSDSIKFEVHKDTRVLTSIDVTGCKTSYTEGEFIDTSDVTVKAYFDDGSYQDVTDYRYFPSGELKPTDTTVTFTYTYEGVSKQKIVPITVAERQLEDIFVYSTPSKMFYLVGETFDPAGMVITARYNNRSFSDVTGYTCSPSSALTLADKTVTITYTEKGMTKTLTVGITVSETPVTDPVLTGLSVTTKPMKTDYLEGETFDTKGLLLYATYSDGSYKKVTDYTYIPSDQLCLGDSKVIVTYKEGNIIKSRDIAITVEKVVPPEKVLDRITISGNVKTDYNVGERFNPSGMVVTAAYTDGTYERVYDYSYAPGTPLTVDDKAIAISYTLDGKTAKWALPITVTDASGGDNGLMIIIIAVIIVALIAVVLVFMLRSRRS